MAKKLQLDTTSNESAEHPSREKPAPPRRATASDVLGQSQDKTTRGGGPVDPKWARHHRLLLRLRGRLSGEGGRLAGSATEPLETFSMDLADAATDEFDHDMALAQLSANRNALEDVEDAIQRILDGRYGVCEVSGRAIPIERLDAIPWARYTIEAETDVERDGEANRRSLGNVASVKGGRASDLEDSEIEDEKRLPDPTDELLSIVPEEAKPKGRAPRQPKEPSATKTQKRKR